MPLLDGEIHIEIDGIAGTDGIVGVDMVSMAGLVMVTTGVEMDLITASVEEITLSIIITEEAMAGIMAEVTEIQEDLPIIELSDLERVAQQQAAQEVKIQIVEE